MWSRYDRQSSVVYRPCTADTHRGQSTPPRRRQDAVVDGRDCRASSRLVRSQSADGARRPPGAAASTAAAAAASTRFHAAAYRRHRGLNLDEEQRRRHPTTHDQQMPHVTSNSAQRRQQLRRGSRVTSSIVNRKLKPLLHDTTGCIV